MPLIAVINVKGGVGKTTSAVYLAAAAAARDLPAAVLDMDPQASASSWLEAAPIEGVACFDAPSPKLLQKYAEAIEPGEVAILDAPPADTPPGALAVAMRLADYVIVPTRPGGLEPDRAAWTLRHIPEGKPRGVLVTSARMQTTITRDSVALWEGEAPLLGVIPERAAVQLGPTGPLSKEVLDLYGEVLDQVLAEVTR